MSTKKEDYDYIHFQITIRILAKRIDQEKLQQVLQLLPSDYVKRGTRKSRAFPKASRDMFLYEIAKCDYEKINSALKKTQKFVGSRANAFVKVHDSLKYETELYFSYQSGLASGGFDLPTSVLSALAKAKMKLRVSIFSWGHAITEKKSKSRSHS